MLQIMVRFFVIAILSAALVPGAPSHAQSLSEVLEAIQNDSVTVSPEGSSPIKRFRSDPDEMRRQLEKARAELSAAEQRGAKLEAEVAELTLQIKAVNDESMRKATAFGNMLGEMRIATGKVMRGIRASLSSFEYPDRTGELKRVAEARTLPTRADLDVLPNAILTEMRAQSEVKTVRLGGVLNASTDGSFSERELIRVGTFFIAAADTGEYVNRQKFPFLPRDPYRLVVFPGEPVPGFYTDMKALSDAEPGEVVRIPFDQKRGALFNESLFGPRD